ncbi:condensation domain-containing protein [Gordonia sp. ABSL11-1]|uniref:condensation domain-containing protein n=1 Tax=Gordonia sp. ABSL11-1 TaxID=3053924 RepID=UPI002573ED62|nr:condensation domain-containing protein [Gordonia sp. ABSL11-1]MDL9945975.1 condensation domain-containing protein [Gordonia sp. ABSL11-1]
MSRTPLLRTTLVGGTPVAWRVADPAGALAAAERTPDGLSFLQIDHVVAAKAKRAQGEPHTGTANSVTVVDGPLDREAMAAALTRFSRRHDELRAIYDVDESGPFRRVAPAESIEYVTEADETPVEAGDAIGYIVDRISSEAVFDAMPGLAYGAIDGGDRFTFYTGSDHSHTDGFSQFSGHLEIAQLYRAIRDGQIPPTEPAGRYTDYIAEEKAIAASTDPADPRIAAWREILAVHGGRVPRFPFDLGLADDELAPAVPVTQQLLSASELDACDVRRGDTSFAGVLYAALAAAQYELLSREHYFTATVLSTRTPEHAFTQGWLCNFVPIAFDVNEGIAFSDLTHIAGRAVVRARDLATLPVHVALGLLAADGSYIPDPGSPQMVSYIDFRRVPGADDPVLQNVTAFQAIGRTRNANMWFTRYHDELTVTSHIPDNPTASDAFDRYVDAIRRRLATFASDTDSPVSASSQVVSP